MSDVIAMKKAAAREAALRAQIKALQEALTLTAGERDALLAWKARVMDGSATTDTRAGGALRAWSERTLVQRERQAAAHAERAAIATWLFEAFEGNGQGGTEFAIQVIEDIRRGAWA